MIAPAHPQPDAVRRAPPAAPHPTPLGRPLAARRRAGRRRTPAALLAAAALLSGAPALATDLPWLPPRGSATLAIELDDAAAGTFLTETESAELEHGDVEREVRAARLTFSFGRNWAIDGRLGEVATNAEVLRRSAGETDYDVGLIWRPVNEQVSPAAPSIALRIGWIGAGGYDPERVHAPGPGSTGVAAAVAVGKVFREALSLSASLASRTYTDNIPAVLSLGASAALLSQPAALEKVLGGMEGGLIFRASYRRDISSGDLNVTGPYDELPENGRFQDLARESSRGALGVALAAGPVEVAAEAYRYLGGRNVPSFDGMRIRLTVKADLLTLLGLL